jgi:rod shape-determining protein MreC
METEVASLKNKLLEQQDTIYTLQNKLNLLSESTIVGKNKKSNPIPADIIGYDTSNFRKCITINAGSKHGIKPNDIVTANNALVGKITTVNGWCSTVQLITDPSSRIPGRVSQTRELVIVEGNATILCLLKYVPRWAKLKKGDEILTSNIGGFYPPSIPIATIIENEIQGGALFQTVKVLPKVDISNTERVLVLPN